MVAPLLFQANHINPDLHASFVRKLAFPLTFFSSGRCLAIPLVSWEWLDCGSQGSDYPPKNQRPRSASLLTGRTQDLAT